MTNSDVNIPAYRPGRAGGMDPGTRRLLLIAGGLAGALVLMVALWASLGQRHGPAPLIAADPGPLKVKPEHAGGMQVAGADEAILSGREGSEEGAASGAPLAPDAEKPAPEILRQMQPEPPGAAKTAAAGVSVPAAAPPAGAPQEGEAAKPPPGRAPALHAISAAPSAGKALSHGVAVQLAALPNEAAARQEWERLKRNFPSLFAARQPVISHIHHDGHDFWRLRASGFADSADARSFCERLRAKGAGCALADF